MDLMLSVCIIAKNEERVLRRCLEALRLLDSELVFVDTGSTDTTVSIASEFTDHVFHFDWTNDFAAAKNYAAAKASNDRILSVDCDEILCEADTVKLAELMRKNPASIGVIDLLNRYSQTSHEDMLIHDRISRLYDRRVYTFQGRIHETLTPLDPNGKLHYFDAPLTFEHLGYQSEETRKEKAARDLKLLKAQLADEGDDPYLYFQLGQCQSALGDKAAAVDAWEQALSMDVDPRLAYVQDMIEAYGYALLDLKRFDQALGLTAVYDSFAKRADFFFLMGLVYMNNARFDEAISEFRKATLSPVFRVEGVNSFKARYNMGVIYEVTGDKEKSIEMYRSCDSYPPAQARLDALGCSG